MAVIRVLGKGRRFSRPSRVQSTATGTMTDTHLRLFPFTHSPNECIIARLLGHVA